jgi:hypothetical protein
MYVKNKKSDVSIPRFLFFSSISYWSQPFTLCGYRPVARNVRSGISKTNEPWIRVARFFLMQHTKTGTM